MSMLIAAPMAIATPSLMTSFLVVGDEVKASQERQQRADPDEEPDDKAAKRKVRRSDDDNRRRDCRRDPISGRCSLYSAPIMAN